MDEFSPEINAEIDELSVPALDPPGKSDPVADKPEEAVEETTVEESEVCEPAAEETACEEVPDAEGESKNEDEDNGEKTVGADIIPSCVTRDELYAALEKSESAVTGKLTEVTEAVKEVNARVSKLRKLADMHEDIENKLNSQINEYKDNFYRRIVNPILVEFFDIQEDMCLDAADADEAAKKLLMGYVDDISTVFGHYGVTVETVKVGDAYDQRIHKPIKRVLTEDITLDKTVAKAMKTLVHSIDGKVVERANVNVYQYYAPVAKTEETKSEAAEESAAEK